MMIELFGANAHNFGAELMMRTVVAELNDRWPTGDYSATPTTGDLQLFAQLGVRSLLPSDGRNGFVRSLPFLSARLAGTRGQRFLQTYGLADPRDASALVDLSGFRLSDQWGVGAAQAFGRVTRAYARNGRPIVLLPQAFGPFRDSAVAAAVKRALEPTTLVIARDSISAQHIDGLQLNIDLRLAPDITLFDADDASNPPHQNSAPVTVVPNARLLDRPGHQWSTQGYLGFLHQVVGAAHRRGLKTQVLLHTTEDGDLELAQRLAQSTTTAIDIVRPSGAADAKMRLRASWAVIGSRFHALAGALSTSRPTIGTGWSHKYAGLFEDFGVPEFLIEPDRPQSAVDTLLEELLSPEGNSRLSTLLARRRDAMRPVNEAMWGAVYDVLASSQPVDATEGSARSAEGP